MHQAPYQPFCNIMSAESDTVSFSVRKVDNISGMMSPKPLPTSHMAEDTISTPIAQELASITELLAAAYSDGEREYGHLRTATNLRTFQIHSPK